MGVEKLRQEKRKGRLERLCREACACDLSTGGVEGEHSRGILKRCSQSTLRFTRERHAASLSQKGHPPSCSGCSGLVPGSTEEKFPKCYG